MQSARIAKPTVKHVSCKKNIITDTRNVNQEETQTFQQKWYFGFTNETCVYKLQFTQPTWGDRWIDRPKMEVQPAWGCAWACSMDRISSDWAVPRLMKLRLFILWAKTADPTTSRGVFQIFPPHFGYSPNAGQNEKLLFPSQIAVHGLGISTSWARPNRWGKCRISGLVQGKCFLETLVLNLVDQCVRILLEMFPSTNSGG